MELLNKDLSQDQILRGKNPPHAVFLDLVEGGQSLDTGTEITSSLKKLEGLVQFGLLLLVVSNIKLGEGKHMNYSERITRIKTCNNKKKKKH